MINCNNVVIVAFLHCRNNAEVSMDIDLKKLNFQGLFKFFLDFSIGYEHFLNQNIKAEKVCMVCMVIK